MLTRKGNKWNNKGWKESNVFVKSFEDDEEYDDNDYDDDAADDADGADDDGWY